METDSEDWIPSTGIKEEFDYETLALLKNFWYTECMGTGPPLKISHPDKLLATKIWNQLSFCF
jgi:hypothetical protein